MVSEVWIPLKMANSAHLIHGVRAILRQKKAYGRYERTCMCVYVHADGGGERGATTHLHQSGVPPQALPPPSLSLIRPTAAPSAPQSPSCHSGRPTD